MATALSLRDRFQNRGSLPEESSTFKNIQETFPIMYEEGINLLQQFAGTIQVMRLATEIFPFLGEKENKEAIQTKEAEFRQISKNVEEYRQSLKTVNGQIKRAIDLCSNVPESDVRVWKEGETAVRVYDLCKEYLPKLRDWQVHGNALEKRFELLMTSDQKNYQDSMNKFSLTVAPKGPSFLSSFTGFFTGWGGSSQPSAAAADDLNAHLEELTLEKSDNVQKKKA